MALMINCSAFITENVSDLLVRFVTNKGLLQQGWNLRHPICRFTQLNWVGRKNVEAGSAAAGALFFLTHGGAGTPFFKEW